MGKLFAAELHPRKGVFMKSLRRRMDGPDEFGVSLPNIAPVYFQRERDGINHVAWNSAPIRPAIDEQVALQITTFAFFVSGGDDELVIRSSPRGQMTLVFKKSEEDREKLTEWVIFCKRTNYPNWILLFINQRRKGLPDLISKYESTSFDVIGFDGLLGP